MATVNSTLIDEHLESDREYWLSKLGGEIVVTGLPLDFQRPAQWKSVKESIRCDLEEEVATRLVAICGREGARLLAGLLAAVNLCLHKYTGQEDIVVGTAIHERYRDVAMLNRVLALRNRVTGDLTADAFLTAVKDTLREAYAHQKCTFERLIEALGIEPLTNRCPLFDVLVLLDGINNRRHVAHLRNDLTICFFQSEEKISAELLFSPALFERRTIEQFWVHLRDALKALFYAPGRRLKELDICSAAETQKKIVDFNVTRQPYPAGTTIHELVERQVERTPDHPAMVCENSVFSYRWLNRRANQLARRLSGLGVGRGDLVGIYLDHCPDLVAAILGILKAGAAYVPLDPSHPPHRIQVILKDAQPKVVVSDQMLGARLASDGLNVLAVDCAGEAWAEEGRNEEAVAQADDLAYVIYTSGSTGTPKGVKIQHRALVNYVWWATRVYVEDFRCQGKSSFALYSSLAFDLTVTSIYTPLISGNEIVIYRSGHRASVLHQILTDDRIDVLKLTPSHLALVLQSDRRPTRIRRLIVGGEALHTDLARRVHEMFSGRIDIFNEYGPTEAAVGCMIHRFDPERDLGVSVPIGRPASNVEIYVLDGDLNPAPENGVGELYIAGDGLADGYLKAEALTRRVFLESPFRAGAKLYKTGDLARWREGKIHYVGRRDEQIKYHGYRIDLAEIRTAINTYPEISQSVVRLQKGREDRELLVAYYVSRKEVDVRELRAFLADRLMEETIPALFVHLTKLPLTLNGKINYQALPSLAQVKDRASHSKVAPRTSTEIAVAESWKKVLDLENVGAGDNFFELGGHSLLAAEAITSLRESLEIDIPLQSLFETPIVEELAAKIDAMKDKRFRAVAIERAPRNNALPLSYAQQRFWFLDSMSRGSAAFNLRAAVRLYGTLNRHALEQAFAEVVRRHEVLRTLFAARKGQPSQIVQEWHSEAVPMADLGGIATDHREPEFRRLITGEGSYIFDLRQGSLMRTRLLRLGEEDHILLITTHHIICDGWSLELLNREVSALYKAFSLGVPSDLPELPVQYGDFAAWQRRQVTEDAFVQQLTFWTRELKDVTPIRGIADHRHSGQPTYAGLCHRFAFGALAADRLRSFTRCEGATLFTTLLAGFQTLLHRYSGEDDIVVGSAIANRADKNARELIGCFINTVALRARMADNPSFRELIRRVKRANMDAQANQDIPFEVVLEKVYRKRPDYRGPLIRTWFALYQPSLPVEQLLGLRLEPLDIDLETAQFDLTLTLQETGKDIVGMMNYDAMLFDSESVIDMCQKYTDLLQDGIAEPESRILDLKLN